MLALEALGTSAGPQCGVRTGGRVVLEIVHSKRGTDTHIHELPFPLLEVYRSHTASGGRSALTCSDKQDVLYASEARMRHTGLFRLDRDRLPSATANMGKWVILSVPGINSCDKSPSRLSNDFLCLRTRVSEGNPQFIKGNAYLEAVNI